VAWRIVIAGGGFGGFYAARELSRRMPPNSARITVVTRENFMLFTPLMAGAAAGTLEPRHVVVPLREELRGVEIRLGEVMGADPDARRLQVQPAHDGLAELPYDHLIVALGSVSRTLPVPGLDEHGVGLKTLAEAIGIRNRLLHTLEVAEGTDDHAARAALLTYVFVGGGYAGLEALAELQDFAADVIDLYPRCQRQGMRWLLLEAQGRVMAEVPTELAEFAARELRGRGVEVLTETTIASAAADHVVLSSGEVVPTHTLVWTAGVRPAPVVARLGLPLDERGRIRVDRFMRVEGRENVWGIGDAAAVPDPARRDAATPPTAQHATRQGTAVARNVAAATGTGRPRPFSYRTRGVFVDMGRQQAVALTFGLKWRGLPAWILARTYYLAEIPGLARKLRLLADWTVGMLFGRDSSELGQIGRPRRLGQDGAPPELGRGASLAGAEAPADAPAPASEPPADVAARAAAPSPPAAPLGADGGGRR
jgi:NADH dehydrogenase